MTKKSEPMYRCNRCGQELPDERIPIEHGKMGITVHPQQPKTYKPCKGKFVKVD